MEPEQSSSSYVVRGAEAHELMKECEQGDHMPKVSQRTIDDWFRQFDNCFGVWMIELVLPLADQRPEGPEDYCATWFCIEKGSKVLDNGLRPRSLGWIYGASEPWSDKTAAQRIFDFITSSSGLTIQPRFTAWHFWQRGQQKC